MHDSYSKYAKLYGLIGYPLGHSFSQNYFNQKFESEGINARYVNFEIPEIDRLRDILAKHTNLAGFNVTLPYKQQVISYLDDIDPAAARIGAVNVVKVTRDASRRVSLKGYNSDIIGFVDSLSPMLAGGTHTRGLVLGTGGAAKAVAYGLHSSGIEPTLVSRTAREGVITYADVTPDVIAGHTIIVNTTPLGMYPHVDDCPDIPYDALTPGHICYDLLYNPDTTLFMRRAARAGATVKNGLEMLLLQAFAAWNIWQRR